MTETLSNPEINHLIELALNEDLNEAGDVTSKFLLNPEQTCEAQIRAKAPGIIAGLPVAERVFQKVNQKISIERIIADGDKVKSGDQILKISGLVVDILTAERTALNFLQRLSGIATLTAEFVGKVQATKTQILDTRKTTPGWRSLEKYAVRMGGGVNHRIGLYDMILIKENHIAASGGILEAVKLAKEKLRVQNLNLKIEVETRNLLEVEEAIKSRVDRIMLDNMTLAQIRDAVNRVAGRVELEVSGGVTLDSVRKIAETGADYISVGALTHSAPSLDISLLIKTG